LYLFAQIAIGIGIGIEYPLPFLKTYCFSLYFYWRQEKYTDKQEGITDQFYAGLPGQAG